MKHLKRYKELFENQHTLTREQIEWLDKCTGTKYTWSLDPETGLVDVDGSFICRYGENTGNFKGVRFGEVTGTFDCDNNELKSLEGAPQEVGGDFLCDDNELKSLEGGPQKVWGEFNCNRNSLTTLKGAPQKVGGDFSCEDNSLTTLEGGPQKVEGDFWCSSNSLSSLEGSPQRVGGDFYCRWNSLTSLEGGPQEVGFNKNSSSFYCSNNFLTSLEGAPKKVNPTEWLICEDNPVSESTLEKIWKEMQSGFTYSESIRRLATDIPKEDWDLLDKTGLEVSDEFLKGASVLRRFS